MRKPFVLLALCLACAHMVAQPSAGQSASPGDRFAAGNRAYQEGRYAEAVQVYRQILDDGNGALGLYHNLGNAYTRLDSTGAAVWAYEKALQFAPHDRRVRHNLEFVRLREGLPVGGLPPRGLVGLVSGWPLGILFGLGVLLLLAGGVAGALRADDEHYLRWSDPLSWGPMSAGVLIVIAALSASYVRTLDRRAVVTGRDVAVRTDPDSAVTPDTTLQEGAMVEVRAENESWVEVRLGDGTVGWVRRGTVWDL